MLKVFVGYDRRETAAYQVCVRSLVDGTRARLDVMPVLEAHVRARRFYGRPLERRGNRLWDVVSSAPMSTEFSLARFAVPQLAGFQGWALFCDCDFLFRADVAELFALADKRFAVMVVKHAHAPANAVKMDGQMQRLYARKNWSSLALWNCWHPANRVLTPEVLTAWHRDDLHAFRWLKDEEIGELPEAWNWLAGHSSPALAPKAVHFTEGAPDMAGYERQAFADDWRAVLASIEGRPE